MLVSGNASIPSRIVIEAAVLRRFRGSFGLEQDLGDGSSSANESIAWAD